MTQTTGMASHAPLARPFGLFLSAIAIYLVLAIPNHPDALAPDLLLVVPLELPVILIGLAVLAPESVTTACVRWAIVLALTVLTVLKLADFATFETYNRGFNPVVDLHLIPAAWNLGSGAVGVVLAAGIVCLAFLAIGGLAALLWWATGRWSRLMLPRVPRRAGAFLLLPATALAIAEIGAAMRHWSLPFDVRGAAFTARVAVERVDMVTETVQRLRAFNSAAAEDPFAETTPLLDRIGQRDVLLTYIESYGAANLTNPSYAPTHLETLRTIEADLSARGLSMRSGWLEAPIIGGQSWLSHATLATGLWVPDQRTYGAALISGRKSLFHLAQDNGFDTVAVMPAITLDWPEAEFMGFDRIFTSTDLGYAGLPFNWVTMPDQFTLAALDRLVLSDQDRAPIFAQVALISSHAPWTPVPELVAWEDIGDGRIFDAVAQSGDPPQVVWRDRDRVRDQFRQAVDYSLQTVGAYAARSAEDPPFLIVLGDHPPALFVSEDEGMGVPIHIIGPADLVEPFAEWGWSDGMIPDPDATVLPMNEFRNRFLTTFSSVSP
ncbi:MAG: sulfatase-like hydrolase/transferase [Pseudomonadota bacterium]